LATAAYDHQNSLWAFYTPKLKNDFLRDDYLISFKIKFALNPQKNSVKLLTLLSLFIIIC